MSDITQNDKTRSEEFRANQRCALEALDSADWTWAHWKAVLVAGSGFLTDSYDNFVISLMAPMIAYVYFGKSSLPALEDGWLKAASAWGNLVGQLFFGMLGDWVGRKKIYGVELIILIVGALGCALASQPLTPGGLGIVPMIAMWRFILGVGVGGDYPVSAVITSEFASKKNRGMMIALVFSMQGIGIFLGALMGVLSVATLHDQINSNVLYLDYTWRFLAGFGAVPALIAVYFRLTITETPRYTMEVEGNVEQALEDTKIYLSNNDASDAAELPLRHRPHEVSKGHKLQTNFVTYFSKRKNLITLICTSATWFFLDIGYYGTNLNTSVVLSAINFSDKSSPYRYIWTTCLGQLIIALCGNVPGYFFTVALVDKWGRKPIQIMGFTMLTIIFTILAAGYNSIKTNSTALFVVLYSLAQFFFNFGPNTTTFIYPAEVFPTAVRSTAHGISAASGKLGAIIAAQLFSQVADIGGAQGSKAFMNGTLGIFAVLCFFGTLIYLAT